MLILEIYINDSLLFRETAQRIIGGTNSADINTYRLSNGTEIKHRYGDGAAKLSEKLLKHIQKRERKGK